MQPNRDLNMSTCKDESLFILCQVQFSETVNLATPVHLQKLQIAIAAAQINTILKVYNI